MEEQDKQEILQPIGRAAKILGSISNGVNSITEIGKSCKLSKSTTHRLLQALIASDLVTQDPISRQYYLGYALTNLIWKPEITHEYLVTCAREEIKRLSDYTGETTSFGLMIALRYVNLYSIPSSFTLRAVEEPLKSDLIHAGAHGKVLLSQLANKDLKTAITSLQTNPVTENTYIDRAKLVEQIELIRKQGYCISSNERATGVMCIAAPIKNYGLPATLYILGPELRIESRMTEYVNNLLSTAARISSNIDQVFHSRFLPVKLR
jgi:DNA-binding IclR family transcriptional regulator